jgi:hypothetical protein
MLVSPKRLVKGKEISPEDEKRLKALTEEYRKKPYMIDRVIQVRKTETDYEVMEGLDQAKAAYLAETPYVPIQVMKE